MFPSFYCETTNARDDKRNFHENTPCFLASCLYVHTRETTPKNTKDTYTMHIPFIAIIAITFPDRLVVAYQSLFQAQPKGSQYT